MARGSPASWGTPGAVDGANVSPPSADASANFGNKLQRLAQPNGRSGHEGHVKSIAQNRMFGPAYYTSVSVAAKDVEARLAPPMGSTH